MSDIGSILSGGEYQSQTDMLAAAYRQTKQPEINALNEKKSTLERRQNFFNTLNSRLNSLVSALDKFDVDDVDSKFVTRAASSSNTSVLTVSASSDAMLTSNSVFVEKLATKDILISQRLGATDSDLFGGLSGTHDFQINGVAVSVDLDGSETNAQAMQKIVDAVNNTEDITVSASYIKDTSTTGRITFVSKETGAENAVEFSEDTTNPADQRLLGRLGLTSDLYSDPSARTQSSGAAAGYQTADSSALNANLTVNGVEVERGTNSISDLIEGVTITLNKTQETGDAPVEITASVGVAEVQNFIKPLLNQYNSLLSYLAGNKSQQRADIAVSSLYSKLRGIVSQEVASAEDGAPGFLTEIGVEIGSDGTLSLNDTTKLKELLEDNPQKVADLFTSEDSFVAKINNAIANLQGSDGLIQSRNESLRSQIEHTKDRTEELESRIDTQTRILRDEYKSMLQSFYESQGQYQLLSTFQMPDSGYYSMM